MHDGLSSHAAATSLPGHWSNSNACLYPYVCRAKEILEDLAAAGHLGARAEAAKVVYAQTDSLFAHLPHATQAEVPARPSPSLYHLLVISEGTWLMLGMTDIWPVSGLRFNGGAFCACNPQPLLQMQLHDCQRVITRQLMWCSSLRKTLS